MTNKINQHIISKASCGAAQHEALLHGIPLAIQVR